MAEVVAAFELAATILGFLDLSKKILDRIWEYGSSPRDLPRDLRGIAKRLPLLNESMLRIKKQIKDGTLSPESEQNLSSTVQGCLESISELREALRSWASKLGLPGRLPIAIGEFDVHYGAIGSGIHEGMLVKAIGTSTCDCCGGLNRRKKGRRHPRHLRHRERPDPLRLLRHRGGAVRRRRSVQVVGRGRLPGRRGALLRKLHARGSRGTEARHRAACSPSTGTTATRTILVDPIPHRPARGPDASHHPRGNLPVPSRGHRVRRARDH